MRSVSYRDVPLRAALQCLFGGFMNQFGWLFFGFGMIFVWLFVGNADLTSWYYFKGSVVTTTGTVTLCEDTGASEGGGEHSRGTPIYAVHYRFSVSGAELQSVSYSLGTQYSEGEQVSIEYPSDKQKLSRIRGLRRSMFSAVVLFVLIFPVIGLCFIIYYVRHGLKALALLRQGVLAEGTLAEKTATNTRVNNRPVYKLRFEFKSQDGRSFNAYCNTHLTEKLEDNAKEHLLYDPLNPERSVMIDSLPGSITLNPMGQIEAKTSAFLVMILPMLAIVGHGFHAYKLLMSTTP